MKRILSVLLFVGLLSSVFPTQAQADDGSMDLMPCDDLALVADNLTEISNAMATGVPIEENDDLDLALADVVDALYYVADSEGSEALYTSAEELSAAWDAMDRDGFVFALDAAVDEFDAIYDAECSE